MNELNDKLDNENDGVRIDIMRSNQLDNMGSTEKIRHIIDHVKDGSIVFLEKGITPDEQALLIEKTMTEIDHDQFKGVDIESYPNSDTTEKPTIIDRILSRNKTTNSDIMLIGPASKVDTIHKDNNKISTILTG